MATIIIDIPDAQAIRVRDSLAAYWDYQTLVDGLPNTETKAQFVKRMIASTLKQWVVQQDRKATAAALPEPVDPGIS